MSQKSFWDSLGDTIGFVLFIKYGLPILVGIIIVLIIIQGVFGLGVSQKYADASDVILTSKFEETICNYAKQIYDQNVFSKVEGDPQNNETSRMYSVEVNYYFKDNNKTPEEYDRLIKAEISKMFDNLKGKTIQKDQIFADTTRESIALTFYIPINGENRILRVAILKYYEDKGFDEETYQELINNTLVSNENLENLIR